MLSKESWTYGTYSPQVAQTGCTKSPRQGNGLHLESTGIRNGSQAG